ncbi:MAG: hypothetical protein ACTHKM_13810 [Tsuneonella sp.]
MDSNTGISTPVRTRGSLRPILIAVVASFLLGCALVGYLAWAGPFAWSAGSTAGHSNSSAPAPAADPFGMFGGASASPSPAPSASATAATKAVEAMAQTQGGIDQRLTAAEQRLAKLDLQAQAMEGNTARAEGLLIAFATRRALDRGAELGYLADQLRLRFGDALPNAVDTVIAFSRNPVTLDVLVAQLEGLGPRLRKDSDEGGLARLQRELSELFVIRRESTPSPQPEKRLERARFFLESGRVDRAIGEVQNLPGADDARAWIAQAQRYAAAQRALDLIETSAVLEPRRLRDGAGRPVEQPSPALQAG